MTCGSQIKLLLLDFDGTLADTQQAHTRAYIEAFREAGYTLAEDIYKNKYFGMRCDEFLSHLGISDSAERDRMRLRKIELYPTFFDTIKLNRPLWNFAQQFRSQGGRVWIVSTGNRANIENAMRHLGIEGGVDGILSGADIADSKPAPDAFLEAMRREGCTPAETLIFEDSEIGLEAARWSGAGYFKVTL